MVKKILERLKISDLNAMQEAALEASKATDVVLLSPTGSGKTLAFLLPLLSFLDPGVRGVQALIIVPARELGLQIEEVFKKMSTGYKVNTCYGGHSTATELQNLSEPPALLIGTPGRLAFHFRKASVDPSTVKFLVLDEFDKSLEQGFEDDMAYIIQKLTRLNRRMLTSATSLDHIPDFSGLQCAQELNFLSEETRSRLTLKAIVGKPADKLEILVSLLCHLGSQPLLIFCNHREAVERVSEELEARGIAQDIYHGGLQQDQRERALIKFRNGSTMTLITTDLASRGLDIPGVQYVIHYQLPHTEEAFTHRNGRTARMNASGTVYLILSEGEKIPYLQSDFLEQNVPESSNLPEPPVWNTLYFAAGKKDKVNKVDIVGLLFHKGKLKSEEIGRIDVLDYAAYVAIPANKSHSVLNLLRGEKLKNKRVKVDLAK